MNAEKLKATWFTSGNSVVGIVQISTEYPLEYKYYIRSVDGVDEQQDILTIVSWGAAFPNAAGDALFGVE